MRLFASGGGVVNCGVVKFLKNFFLLFDSDPHLQFQTMFGEGVTNSQTPSVCKSTSNFLTQEEPDKSLEVLRHYLLKRNWLCIWCRGGT